MKHQLVGAGKGCAAREVDKARYDANYEAIFGTFKPRFSGDLSKTVIHDKASTLDNKNSSISVMMKDRTMVRMIREGKANDRGLKREAERIERENSNRPKESFRQQQQLKLMQLKAELRRSQR
jgi:hypothetical protein